MCGAWRNRPQSGLAVEEATIEATAQRVRASVRMRAHYYKCGVYVGLETDRACEYVTRPGMEGVGGGCREVCHDAMCNARSIVRT